MSTFEIDLIINRPITEGPFPLEARYTLKTTGSGTHLILVIEGQPGGFFKLAEPLVVSMAKRSYESDLHNLKDLLEAQAA